VLNLQELSFRVLEMERGLPLAPQRAQQRRIGDPGIRNKGNWEFARSRGINFLRLVSLQDIDRYINKSGTSSSFNRGCPAKRAYIYFTASVKPRKERESRAVGHFPEMPFLGPIAKCFRFEKALVVSRVCE
jgi:hypothetical protein